MCAPGTQRCVGAGMVSMCGANAQWGPSWQCAAAACSSGACTGSTAKELSCQPGGAGLTTCPGGTGSENCCTTLEVPGGTYYRSYANSGGGPTGATDAATVNGFRLDKYLVTVGRFRQFVADWRASHWTPADGSGKHDFLPAGGLENTAGCYETGWDAAQWNTLIAPTDSNLACNPSYATWTSSASTNESLPMNCVNWYEAYAFCIWDGGFLPSEAEWEFAAAGGSQQLEYPWGSTAPGSANKYAIYACDYPTLSGLGCSDVKSIAPVGTALSGAGVWGQLDLGGDLYEWNLDWYASYVDPCTNCVDLTTASGRVVRGGDFENIATTLLAATRGERDPVNRPYDIGFRCAESP